MSVDCFKKAGLPHLQDQVESLTKNGMPEKEALSTVANKHFNETIKELSDELNKIRKAAKLPVEEAPQFDPSPAIQAIEEKYKTPPAEPPKPPTQAPSEGQGMPEMGTRETVAKLQEESKLDQRLKDALDDYSQYEVKKQAVTQKRARQTIDRLGEDEALRQATSFKWGRSIEEKMALLGELGERFSNQFREAAAKGDKKAELAAYDKYMAAMEGLTSHITDTAQALSYLRLVGRMFETRVGAVRFAQRQIDESREGALRNYEQVKLTVEKVLEEFDKLGREDFLKSKKVQDLMAEINKSRSVQSRRAHKELSEAGNALKKAWSELNSMGITWDPKSQAAAHLKVHKALLEYVKKLIKTILTDTGESIKAISEKAKEKFKEELKELKVDVNPEDADALIDDEINAQTAKHVEKKYKKDIKEAIKDYVSGKNRNKQDLVDHIVNVEQLSEEQAKAFTEQFDKLFQEYATKEKQKLINKYAPKGKVSEKGKKQRTEFYDKVIQLSNAGALSDRQLDDQLAQAFGLPAMTPEIAAKIEEMVDAINKTPEGSRFRNIAITKLTDYIAQQQKFNWTDYMLSSYKAGIFSGIDTQALNLQGNMFNVLELGFMLGFTNPAKAARFYRAFARPESLSRSMNEALEILKTGYDPRSTGDSRRALERTPRSFFGLGKPLKGAKQMFDPSLEQQKKYVFRALSAGDLLFSTSINDALQNELLMREAHKQGLRGKEADKYVREQMGYTPENIKKQAQIAEQEAKSGAIPNDRTSIALRTYELIEQQRNPDVVKAARQYASQQIMTNTPNGFIGIFARNVNRLIHEIPVLSAFIPVVNFAANAMSRAVQYMPHTALARAIAHGVRDRTAGIHFSTQIKNLVESYKTGDFETEMRLRRALIGTVTMAVLIALLGDDDNDENILSKLLGKKIKIHGSGPGTQFNRQKTYQLQESGWLPYSIQVGDKYIPYKNYPALNVLLASMGEWNDAVRYKKLSRKDAAERFIFAMGNSFKVISEMGFLTSLNTLLSAALEGEVKNFVDVPSRIATGELVPKFQRNLVNLFDNKIYASGDIQEMTTRSLPVVNTFANEPMVNALGEPIEKNWWDRVQLWNTDTYSKHKPIWSANADKKYFFSTPNRYNLEDKIGHRLTTEEYNQYFKYRGEEIVKNWTPEIAKLSPEKYAQKMDRITKYADYKTLVRMGAMKSDVMKDINFMLDDALQIQRDMREVKKQIFE